MIVARIARINLIDNGSFASRIFEASMTVQGKGANLWLFYSGSVSVG